ncbi:14 kDa phosphohistidine phosphatase [Lamellibrachia satsuma]|nr:14 kDa phosphohistidine phosphatase [Lamellibrachia satsuma]
MEKANLDEVEDVDIDDNGRFKYVLIKLYHPNYEENYKYIVRGYKWAGFHADVYEDLYDRVQKKGLDTECVGGGRILHEAGKKTITVYGYSQGYGLADHSITCELLKKKYKDYVSITWNNDGY